MRELEKKQKADEEGGTVTNNHSGLNSSNSGPHSLIQHTSSSNSNHNNSNIHSASGKRVMSLFLFIAQLWSVGKR